MLSTQILYQQPVFRDGVLLIFKDTAVEIRNRHSGFSLTIDPEIKDDLTKFLKLLQTGGLSPEQLSQACGSIAEDIPELLRLFSDRHLLEETQREITSKGLTGRQFYRELCRFCDRLKRRFPPSNFSQKMADGTISVNQLLGYVLESYHVTHLCPRLLAPALANYESKITHKLLQEFYVSELNHDRLIESSLKSVDISADQLEWMQPLPMTFAVCSTLGVFAQQHPLSFKAALMLFEEDEPQFHQLFEQQCSDLGLPTEFYRPILLHAQINEDGAHQEITEHLLAEVVYVSPEEQLLVKKNMANLMESMVLRTHEILNYYGNPDSIIPRCFKD